jgi:phage replication O-like protein O
MANPQIEDGHVDLANEIIEALAKIRISGEEMQCLWVIFRKTYGWHKKEDHIALSQFSEMTSLKKPAICRALSKLLSKKIIIIIKNDNRITSYGFNKDFEQWQPLSKKITLSKKIKSSLKKDNASLSLLRHTKETTTKETIQKKARTVLMADEKFWKEVREIYTWVDIHREIQKMKGYMLTPKGKRWRMTQQRVIEWLGRIDRPISYHEPENLKTKEIDGKPSWIKDAFAQGFTIDGKRA